MCILLGLLFISGIFQLLAYKPEPGLAYFSVQQMYAGSFSGWMRNIHYWSGNLLVIVASMHLCRVYLTGAISGARTGNWYIGLLLFTLVLAANFSGYLLPWDQLAYWAATIFLNMIAYIPFAGEYIVRTIQGGGDIGAPTLALFHTVHTGILPVITIILIVLHFWQIRKNNGLIKRATAQDRAMIPVAPHLLSREIGLGAFVAAAVVLFAALVDAPLAEIANPGTTPNPAKAAWFFLGFQEMLMHLHPMAAIFVLPILILALMVSLPLVKTAQLQEGLWFGGNSGMKTFIWACLCSVIITFAVIFADELVLKSDSAPADLVTRGLIPVGVIAGFYLIAGIILRKVLKLSGAQTVLAGVGFTITAIICLTFSGIWLRGEGMRLILLG